FQVGAGANNKNVAFGASGWFDWNVTSQPTAGPKLEVTGQGDFNVDLGTDCVPTAPECDVRSWDLRYGNKVVRWPLKNLGDDPVTISSIMVQWPGVNGKLRKVKLGPETIFDDDLAGGSASIGTSDWPAGSEADRTLDPGEKRSLKFIFSKYISKDPYHYDIWVAFEEGCSVHLWD
ncbi:MAG: hypothetical protein AAF481_14025, partial [Acidobacteriota bacterium]